MATSRQPWSVPGVILFSHGDLSYEVDLFRPLLEELAQSRLGEMTVPAYERTEKMMDAIAPDSDTASGVSVRRRAPSRRPRSHVPPRSCVFLEGNCAV